MFNSLEPSRPDAILALMQAFSADAREDKVDLGVGVYKDADGATPVLRAVQRAEQRLLETQTTKSYVSPVGLESFRDAMCRQVFGADADLSRIRCAQAVGGSGALRILGDLLRRSRPEAGLHLSDPTWPNHVPLLKSCGFALHDYPYYDRDSGQVAIVALLDALRAMPEGDIVVLHGCCHNPTGADLTLQQWRAVLDVVMERSLFPFIDLAYQGFGDGLEEDAAAVRLFADHVPEMAVAASCSKNLGLYRERVGAALLLAQDTPQADLAFGQLGTLVRSNYSMPPDHGARSTDIVLSDPVLSEDWKAELESMRQRMMSLRQRFADGLRQRSNSPRFDAVAGQRGMFSLLPLTPAHIETLRERHGIYLVGSGRINVAGLPDDEPGMAALCEAIVAVGSA